MTVGTDRERVDFLPSRGKEVSLSYDEHGSILVHDHDDMRYLCLGSPCEQSCLSKMNPSLLQHEYTRAMMLVLLFSQPKSVTILGLGGGALVHCLYQHLPSVKITAIEFRRAVIDTAYRFFQLPRDAGRINVIEIEAGNYLARAAANSIDIIFSDLFNAYDADSQQTDSAFYMRCHRLLTDDGWLVVNYDEHNIDKLREICGCFASLYLCAPSTGNLIMLASKKNTTADSVFLKERAIELSKILGFSVSKNVERLVQLTG